MGGKRGRPKRKAQRRAKWQHEQRFTKRHKRQGRHGVVTLRDLNEQLHETYPRLILLDDDLPDDDLPDGAPGSPYRERKEA